MTYLLYTLFPWIIGLLGLIVGSFLNVVIMRWNTGQGIGGRSHCVGCDKKLSVRELFPVISFLIQRGRCRNCNMQLSWQYPLVEIITAILFFLAGNYFLGLFWWDLLSVWFWVGLIALLWMIGLIVAIAVYDWETQTIPVRWIVGLVITGIIFLVCYYGSYEGLDSVAVQSHLLGLLVAVPFLVLYLFSHGRWMGFADIEIIAWMGLMSGFFMGISAVILAFYLGAAYATGLIVYHVVIKKQSYQSIRKKSLAFAPFLLAGFVISNFFNISVISLIGKLFL